MLSALEAQLIKSYKEEMISFLKSNPEYFDEAVQLAITDNQPFAWRSAWLLWSCMEKNDKRIKKYIKAIIDSIKNKKDGHQRELLKILLEMELNENQEGIIFNLCMNLWEQPGKNPSVRYTAMKFIIKMVKKYPELADEIKFLMDDHYFESLSPGIKESVVRMMKGIKQN